MLGLIGVVIVIYVFFRGSFSLSSDPLSLGLPRRSLLCRSSSLTFPLLPLKLSELRLMLLLLLREPLPVSLLPLLQLPLLPVYLVLVSELLQLLYPLQPSLQLLIELIAPVIPSLDGPLDLNQILLNLIDPLVMLVQVFPEGLQLLHEAVLLNHGLLDLPRDLLRPQVFTVLPARRLHFSHQVQLRQLSLFEIPQFIHHSIVM